MRLRPDKPPDDPADDCCRVCGRRGDLSFEHLPPRAAGNDSSAWMYGIEEWLARTEPGRGPVGRATIQQRGSGVHTLCRACNELAGERYVPELLRWTRIASEGLANSVPPLAELDRTLEPAYVTATFERLRPARFLKQVATMLLALTPGGFPAHHPDLCAFAQDPEWVGLPEKYQFYLALYCGPHARFNGGAARLSQTADGGFDTDFVIELAYPPFSYVLSLDERSPSVETGNITRLADLGIDQTADVEIQMRVGFGHTIFPLDYRSKASLDADRAAHEAA